MICSIFKKGEGMDKEKIDRLVSLYQELPQEIQSAVIWIMEHNEIVDYLVQGEKIPKKEIEEFIQNAMEKKDYLMVVMLIYKRVYDMDN